MKALDYDLREDLTNLRHLTLSNVICFFLMLWVFFIFIPTVYQLATIVFEKDRSICGGQAIAPTACALRCAMERVRFCDVAMGSADSCAVRYLSAV